MYEADFQQQQILTQALAPPDRIREQITYMERLPAGQEVQIDTDTSIYQPEWIGLSAQEDDKRISVVGEIGIPGGQINESGVGFIALIKEEHPDGWVTFGIQGLKADSRGQAHVVTTVGRVHFPPGGELVIGRNADLSSELAKDARLVSVAAIWGRDTPYYGAPYYGANTSRTHVKLRSADGALFVEDLNSTKGTLIRAQIEGASGSSGDSTRHTIRFAAT